MQEPVVVVCVWGGGEEDGTPWNFATSASSWLNVRVQVRNLTNCWLSFSIDCFFFSES